MTLKNILASICLCELIAWGEILRKCVHMASIFFWRNIAEVCSHGLYILLEKYCRNVFTYSLSSSGETLWKCSHGLYLLLEKYYGSVLTWPLSSSGETLRKCVHMVHIFFWRNIAEVCSRQSGRRWQLGCQPYAPAALYPQKYHLVLISVRG
jgi:hypothetical protein